MRRSSVSALVLLAILGTTTRANAQEEAVAPETAAPTGLAITLSVPDGCPDRSALESEIASLLGRPFDEIVIPESSRTTLTIEEDGARYVLVVVSESGERTLRDRSCPALVRAGALIVALQIDADTATLAAASAAEASQAAADALVAPPALPPAPVRSRAPGFVLERAERLGDPATPFRLPLLAIGLGVALDAGLVPSVAGSFFADVVVRVDRFELRGRFAYAVEQGHRGAVDVRASAVTGTLLACGRPFDASFALAFCGGVEGGDLFARSIGISNPMASDGGFFSAVVGLWLPVFPGSGLDVSLGAEGWLRLTRPIFEVSGAGMVYAPDPYGGRFAIAIHFHP